MGKTKVDTLMAKDNKTIGKKAEEGAYVGDTTTFMEMETEIQKNMNPREDVMKVTQTFPFRESDGLFFFGDTHF